MWITLISIPFPNEYRNRFLSSNIMETSFYISKTDSISSIKFIGRQYCCLTDIMDQLNYCYSFQVNVQSRFVHWHCVRYRIHFSCCTCSDYWFYALWIMILYSDDVYYWHNIHIVYCEPIFVLLVHHSTKSTIHIFWIGAFWLAYFRCGNDIDDNLYHNASNQRSMTQFMTYSACSVEFI